MNTASPLLARLLDHLLLVREGLGLEPCAAGPDTRFAEALDSMGLVEFVALVADDCGVTAQAVERAAGHRFGTVADLAAALQRAGLAVCAGPEDAPGHPDCDNVMSSTSTERQRAGPVEAPAWLLATAAELPADRQPAADLDALLGRPAGWLRRHAGIQQRCRWGAEDPLEAAARAARRCLDQAGREVAGVGVLLVVSEAPPLLAGLGAALHHALGLPTGVPVLDLGGACTGFLTGLWTAARLLPGVGTALLVAVEAHTLHLPVRPGAAGEAAALFGDAAAACLLGDRSTSPEALPLRDVVLAADGTAGHLLRVHATVGGADLLMDGPALVGRVVPALAEAAREVTQRHDLMPGDMGAVVVHGGNGRLPGLLARRLGLPAGRVWSETAVTGNLGSASLPVAWAVHTRPASPVIWAAGGAGLLWGAALFGAPGEAQTGQHTFPRRC